MYTTTWCGYCRRLKRALAVYGVEFDEVDIEERPEFAIRIEEATGGFRTVPTIDVAGQLLVNPSVDDVLAAISA